MTVPKSTDVRLADITDITDITQTLATRALNAGSVFKTALESGLTLFAYPAEHAMVIGIGYHRNALTPLTIENALSRRFEFPQRYACWLPALLADGSFVVMQKRPRDCSNGDTCKPTSEEIGNAMALFAE